MAKRLVWEEWGDVYITTTTLNNKSRKGKYILIKDIETGKKSAFKLSKGIDLAEYYTAFKSGIRAKKLSVKGRVRDVDKYRQKIKKMPKIDDIIRVGQQSTLIKNLYGLKESNKRGVYKRLLYGLVKDKLLLNILTEDGNIDKIKHRLYYEIIINKDEPVAKLKVIGKDLSQIKEDVLSVAIGGMFSEGGIFKLKQKGYQTQQVDHDLLYDKTSRIKGISVKVVYTRNK